MSQAEPQSTPVKLKEAQATEKLGYNPGDQSAVVTFEVPHSKVWAINVGKTPIVALPVVQEHTIGSGATETVTLNQPAPKCPFLKDTVGGEYTEDSYIVIYDVQGGTVNEVVDGSTSTVQYTGTFTDDDSFVQEVELTETAAGGSRDLEIWYVARQGTTSVRRRSTGKQNVHEDMQKETNIGWSLQDPYSPDADSRIRWDNDLRGINGILPPKFVLELVFFDDSQDVEVRDATDTALTSDPPILEVSLPIVQRNLTSEEERTNARDLKTQVVNSMASN